MNIRVVLSQVAGSDEKTIEAIEQAIKDRQPFGLKCQRSTIVFIPHQYRVYWIWSDGEPGPAILMDNLKDFVNHIKVHYLAHKQLLTTDELLGMAEILKYEQQRKSMAALRSGALSQSGQPAGSLEAGN